MAIKYAKMIKYFYSPHMQKMLITMIEKGNFTFLVLELETVSLAIPKNSAKEVLGLFLMEMLLRLNIRGNKLTIGVEEHLPTSMATRNKRN